MEWVIANADTKEITSILTLLSQETHGDHHVPTLPVVPKHAGEEGSHGLASRLYNDTHALPTTTVP